MKKFVLTLLVLGILFGGGFVLIAYWPYIFARTVEGVVVDVQRVSSPTLVVGSGIEASSRELFSFAIAIKENSGEIATASSEDRQWAVVKRGQCAQAKFYPYPPWKFDKSGTFYGARLLKLHVCTQGQDKELEESGVQVFPTNPPPEASPAEPETAPEAETAPQTEEGSTPQADEGH